MSGSGIALEAASPEATGVSTAKFVAAAKILERSVCLVLRCSTLGNKRNVSLSSLKIEKNGEEIEREKKALSMTKRLVESKELAPGRHIIGSAKAYLRSVAHTADRIFGDGTYLVPSIYVTEADERLVQYVADLDAWKASLAAQWPGILERAEAALGPLFDSKQYKDASEAAEAFGIEWSYVSFSAPDRLLDVDAAIAARANADFQAKCAAAHDEIVVGLRERAYDVMRELAERLEPRADGKAKALHATALRDLQELIDRLPGLNIGDDDKLSSVMATIAARADGISVEMLKDSSAVRAMMAGVVSEAVGKLDELVSTARRGIRLDA